MVLNSNVWKYVQPEHAKLEKALNQWLRKRINKGGDTGHDDLDEQ